MIASKSVDDLFITVKRAAIGLQNRMKKEGYDLGFSSTYRDIENQNLIYAQGRTTPGNIVTNAKGGQSYHNYRLAFDIFQNKKGLEYDMSFINLAGSIGTKMGLEWGGNWKDFIDYPHFQWAGGLTLNDLQKGLMPSDKKLVWELVPQPAAKAIAPKEIELEIDGKIYKIASVLIEDFNYIKLADLAQAGYTISYDLTQKLPSLKKSK